MEKIFIKMKVLLELILTAMIAYVALTWSFSSIIGNIVLIIVSLFILSQALGNIDKLNGFNKNNNDTGFIELSENLDDDDNENITPNQETQTDSPPDNFADVEFIPDLIPDDDDNNIDNINTVPDKPIKQNIDDGVDENNTFNFNNDYPEIPE